jgi:hypothetical protein
MGGDNHQMQVAKSEGLSELFMWSTILSLFGDGGMRGIMRAQNHGGNYTAIQSLVGAPQVDHKHEKSSSCNTMT